MNGREQNEQLKGDFDRLLSVAEKLAAAAKERAAQAQQIQDVAIPIRDAVCKSGDSPIPDHSRVKEVVCTLNQIAAESLSRMEYPVLVSAVENFTNTASVSVMCGFFKDDPRFEPERVAVNRALENSQVINKAKWCIRNAGLDQPGGGRKGAMELLGEAESDLKLGSPRSLIAMRECIHVIVGELNRLRPTQEKVADRIVSIGQQCGIVGVAESTFRNLESDYRNIANELCAGKQDRVSRNELVGLFNRGAQFVVTLLSSIDKSKLRK
jgi:hypothetical protein